MAEVTDQFDKDFPPMYIPQSYEAPSHSEAPCVLFCAYYTPDGQQKNITIRANALEDLFRNNTDLENFTAEQGWLPTPPGFTANKAQAHSNDPVYEDIPQGGPTKLEVQAIEMKFTTGGKHPGTPYLKVSVIHPSITKPIFAWHMTFKDKGIGGSIPPNLIIPKDQVPAAIKFVFVDQGTNQKGELEWQVKSFTSQA